MLDDFCRQMAVPDALLPINLFVQAEDKAVVHFAPEKNAVVGRSCTRAGVGRYRHLWAGGGAIGAQVARRRSQRLKPIQRQSIHMRMASERTCTEAIEEVRRKTVFCMAVGLPVHARSSGAADVASE